MAHRRWPAGADISALGDELLESREDALTAPKRGANGLTERFAAATSIGEATAEPGGDTANAGVVARVVARSAASDGPARGAGGESGAVGRAPRLSGTMRRAAGGPALRAITDARQQLVENARPVLTLEGMMLSLPVLQSNAVATRLR